VPGYISSHGINTLAIYSAEETPEVPWAQKQKMMAAAGLLRAPHGHFIPPTPNELTPARRGDAQPISGCVLTHKMFSKVDVGVWLLKVQTRRDQAVTQASARF